MPKKMEVEVAGVRFKNPLIAASGTFGYGREYEKFYSLSNLGGISVKGTTDTPRMGNLSPRIAETPMGMLNSVGLENPGIDHFIEYELPWLMQKNTTIIANIAAGTEDLYAKIAQKLDKTNIHMVELNISCPNVKQGGAAFGTSAQSAFDVVSKVRKKTSKPLMVKLSPNVASIAEIAKAVESAGADAVSLINTVLGMRIDIKTRRPILRNNVGGLSGPAIFPIAVRMVWQVRKAVKIPVVGGGGISSAKDAIEMMVAGACAFQIGTAIFTNPYSPLDVLSGIEAWMDDNNIQDINEIVGTVEDW